MKLKIFILAALFALCMTAAASAQDMYILWKDGEKSVISDVSLSPHPLPQEMKGLYVIKMSGTEKVHINLDDVRAISYDKDVIKKMK